MTCEMPSAEFELSWSMPLIVLTASSTLSVTSLSTCSGAAPGRRVVTVTVGKSTFGRRSTPSWPKANAPTTVSERMRTDAKTGRRTQSSASHCMDGPYEPESWSVGGGGRPRTPSTSWLTFVVATCSPAFRPVVISTRSPTA